MRPPLDVENVVVAVREAVVARAARDVRAIERAAALLAEETRRVAGPGADAGAACSAT